MSKIQVLGNYYVFMMIAESQDHVINICNFLFPPPLNFLASGKQSQ